ncbi:protein CHLOROPLAST J-LIKE DOMAIN 1, chloroplastic-like [Lolium perenne]|uniref:protein CHLOROPLAST J-LIKE DOMAIN 1, chloroplastic-like n=1 Tax=Lolium perenne TaxID=4522 RepID=UPI003A99BB92
MVLASRVIPIGSDEVARRLQCAVDAGEEDEAPFLLFDIVSWHGLVLVCLGQVGGLRCWARPNSCNGWFDQILGIGTLDGFDQVKMAYKRRRKDTEISGDTEYLLKLWRAYDAVMMEQLQNRKKGVVNGSVQVLKHIKYADNQPVVPWGPRYSRSSAMDLRINMAISATSTLCMLTMGHADWKPLQFVCFAYFCRMLEKLNSTEPAITPAYNKYVEVEGRCIHMAKRVLRCFGLILGLIFAASLGYTGLTNFSQFLGHYIPPVVYNCQLWVEAMSSAIAALTDKGFADLYPEDGPTVDGGDNIEARALDAYRRSARLDVRKH